MSTYRFSGQTAFPRNDLTKIAEGALETHSRDKSSYKKSEIIEKVVDKSIKYATIIK